MSLIDFQVITLACHGTLTDKPSGIHAALRPLLDRAAVKLKRADVLDAFAAHESAIAAAAPGMRYTEVLVEAHRRLAKDWYVIASEDDHRLFGMSVRHWPVFVNTPAALQYLKRYFKLAVLSNAERENFSDSILRLGVRFDAIFTAQEIGSYKPNPRAFDYMIDKLEKSGIKKRHILHAAQSPTNDIRPASRRGLATAWIDRRRESAAGNATLGPVDSAGCELRFSSLANLVIAHQECLRA